MIETRRTGRDQHQLVELPPSRCSSGHPLGPSEVLVGYGSHSDGGRRRTWTCRTCGEVIWDEA